MVDTGIGVSQPKIVKAFAHISNEALKYCFRHPVDANKINLLKYCLVFALNSTIAISQGKPSPSRPFFHVFQVAG